MSLLRKRDDASAPHMQGIAHKLPIFHMPHVTPQYRKVLVVVGIVSLALLFVVFFVRPSITGYGVYKKIQDANYTLDSYESQLHELEKNLVIASTNLSSCQKFYADNLNLMNSYSEKVSSCESSLASIREELNSKITGENSELGEAKEQLEEKQIEYDELKEDFDVLAEDAATKICCIKKQLENSDINSYDVDGNKIICSASGDYSINCG